MAVFLNTDSTYKLSRSVSYTPSTRVNEIAFGDGYKQTALDGINTDGDEWTLAFVPMDIDKANGLASILRHSNRSTEDFLYWTSPTQSSAQYWTASGVNMVHVSYGFWQVSCTLTRTNVLM